MTKNETMAFALRVIEQLITTGLTEYTYNAVMSSPNHPVNQAREMLMDAIQSEALQSDGFEEGWAAAMAHGRDMLLVRT